ncbi:MAG TPA: hypothetical protein VGN17_12570 [Bryobacteraceae bacterium]
MPENDMARPVLIVIDAQTVGHNPQILDSPVARMTPHFGEKLRRARHHRMVSRAVPEPRSRALWQTDFLKIAALTEPTKPQNAFPDELNYAHPQNHGYHKPDRPEDNQSPLTHRPC